MYMVTRIRFVTIECIQHNRHVKVATIPIFHDDSTVSFLVSRKILE